MIGYSSTLLNYLAVGCKSGHLYGLANSIFHAYSIDNYCAPPASKPLPLRTSNNPGFMCFRQVCMKIRHTNWGYPSSEEACTLRTPILKSSFARSCTTVPSQYCLPAITSPNFISSDECTKTKRWPSHRWYLPTGCSATSDGHSYINSCLLLQVGVHPESYNISIHKSITFLDIRSPYTVEIQGQRCTIHTATIPRTSTGYRETSWNVGAIRLRCLARVYYRDNNCYNCVSVYLNCQQKS